MFSIQSPSTLAIGKGAEVCNQHWRKGRASSTVRIVGVIGVPRVSRKRAANLVLSPVLVRNLITTVFESKRKFQLEVVKSEQTAQTRPCQTNWRPRLTQVRCQEVAYI